MIAHLRGRLIEKESESVVLDVAGVGYHVATSAATMRTIAGVGVDAQLWIYTHYTQDGGPTLYGFSEREERVLFETLLSVQGVGPKVALAMLSGMPRAELMQAIAGADIARLIQIRGVGRKTAERLAVELRDKIVPFPVTPAGLPGGGAFPGAGGGANATSALPERLLEVQGAMVALGYRPQELEVLIARMDPSLPIADLIKQGLAALRRI